MTVEGASTQHSSVADSKSNSGRKIAEFTGTNGLATDGGTISLWGARVTTQIETTDTVTLTIANAVAAKISGLLKADVTAGNTFTVIQVGEGAADALEASVSDLTAHEYLLIGLGGASSNDGAKTPDADYTEMHDERTGVGAGASAIHTSVRVATLTADTCTSTNWMPQIQNIFWLLSKKEVDHHH